MFRTGDAKSGTGGANFGSIAPFFRLVAAAATPADAATARESFTGEPDVLGNGVRQRIAGGAHRVVSEMFALPGFDGGAGGAQTGQKRA